MGEQPNNGTSHHHLSQDQAPGNPEPASNYLPNNGTSSDRKVSNDSHVALSVRPDHEPAPQALPANRPTSARRHEQDVETINRGNDVDVAEPVADGGRFLANCASSAQEKKQ